MSLLEELNERYKTIADEAEKLDAHRRTLMLGMNELLPAIWALEAEQKKNASGFDDGEAMRKAQADASKTARTVTAEQAPAQADPPSELRSVTPATEEIAGDEIEQNCNARTARLEDLMAQAAIASVDVDFGSPVSTEFLGRLDADEQSEDETPEYFNEEDEL